jgi:hypothetical protein
MVGTGARFYLALAAIALVAAGLYGLATDGDLLGELTLGYKGGVGAHFGYVLFGSLGLVALVVGLILAVIHDADPIATTTDAVPEAVAPSGASPWPVVGAFGVVITLLGLAVGWLLFVLGLVILVITIVEWTVRVWSDRATGDPEVNRAIRNRFMAPIEIPVAALLIIGFVVVGVSRVLLAVSATTAVVVGTIVLVLVVIAAVVVATRPRQSSAVLTALLLIGALAVVAGGIAGVAVGERDIHEDEPTHETGQ